MPGRVPPNPYALPLEQYSTQELKDLHLAILSLLATRALVTIVPGIAVSA